MPGVVVLDEEEDRLLIAEWIDRPEDLKKFFYFDSVQKFQVLMGCSDTAISIADWSGILIMNMFPQCPVNRKLKQSLLLVWQEIFKVESE